MENLPEVLAKSAAIICGLGLVIAVIYTIIKYNPTPYRNISFAVLALGFAAIGADTPARIGLTEKGLEIELDALQRKITQLTEEVSQFRTVTADVAQIRGVVGTLANDVASVTDVTSDVSSRLEDLVRIREVVPGLSEISNEMSTLRQDVVELASEVHDLNTGVLDAEALHRIQAEQATLKEAWKRISSQLQLVQKTAEFKDQERADISGTILISWLASDSNNEKRLKSWLEDSISSGSIPKSTSFWALLSEPELRVYRARAILDLVGPIMDFSDPDLGASRG